MFPSHIDRNSDRNESALYWSAVNLIVCEGLSIAKAAERLGIGSDRLRNILQRRQCLRPQNATRFAKSLRLS